MTTASRFQNKNIIVTGGASGIGRATVIRLVGEGGTVLAVDLDEAGLQETLAQANAVENGGRAFAARLSITDEQAVRSTVQRFAQDQGRLDVLVNMAGVLCSTHTTETSFEDFMRVVQINLGGTFLCCREALPFLLESKGNIVNAASTSAFFGHPYMAAYSASKGGVAALTQALSREYIKRGVRVNAVAPGGIATPMVAAQAQGFPAQADLSLFMHLTRPDRKLGAPQEVAAVIAMLASDDGAFVNGAVLRIDGGTHG
ncbi:NAD(P)-dependent dehydrogenase, short-chain alcohol dehydrogenase family [Pseudomonas sp. ok272]|uniref:SDR family NAD(P)-dependent oxidoreductase n=1 Tax=unclassified Pseudomonas TaxID=196821 RepID=UPI0008BF6260|nr:MULTISPECIES: SDR family oxidoreductase [unclassified Pseudomonas]SEN43141.1 NAD(P)-dependent dehydrogenase, short-chain alcohol dehydrogenase family [Pseudomonas sp. ok272]SFN25238.1 NAD(P)-dependent dehydrogenase, short-chain alcohol dehydrogenase family [Pseudomonas sp. ok602]